MIKALKYDPYLQTTEFIQWIESYANDGWFINGLNQDSLWVTFRKSNPQKVKYALYAIENSKLFNKDEFLDIAKEQGWNMVGYGTYMRELYLFINELENPIPLETDPLEQVKKNQNLKRLALWSFGFSILVAFIYFGMPTKTENSFRWLPVIAYSYIALIHMVQALRTGYAGDESKEKRNHIAGIVKRLRISLVGSVLILLVSLSLYTMHTAQQFIEVNPLVEWNLKDNQSIENESYSASRFSLVPNSTSLVTILEEGYLTRSIYQTKQNYLWFTVQDFHKLIKDNIDWFIYDETLRFETNQAVTIDRVIFQSNNKMEYWSFVKQGNTLLTLHTINLTKDEHQSILKKMEETV